MKFWMGQTCRQPDSDRRTKVWDRKGQQLLPTQQVHPRAPIHFRSSLALFHHITSPFEERLPWEIAQAQS